MDILRILILMIGVGVSLSALFNVLVALFPTRIEYTRHEAETATVRAFFLGLVNFLFFGALTLGFMTLGSNIHGIFFLPGFLFLSLIGVGVTFGLGGVVQLVGNRLFAAQSPVRQTSWGAVTLYLASLAPFVGWFGVLSYIGLLGLGAFILSFFHKMPGDSLLAESGT